MDSGHTAGVLVWSRWWPVSSPSHTHSKNKHVSCQLHISVSWQSSKDHCVSFHFDPGGHMPFILHVTVAGTYEAHTCGRSRESTGVWFISCALRAAPFLLRENWQTIFAGVFDEHFLEWSELSRQGKPGNMFVANEKNLSSQVKIRFWRTCILHHALIPRPDILRLLGDFRGHIKNCVFKKYCVMKYINILECPHN